jgi:multidrug efflux pump subunit AcrA (membrane-fusion protein)
LRRESRWLGEEIRQELRTARSWTDWLKRAADLATRQVAATGVFVWNPRAASLERRLEGLCFPADGLAPDRLEKLHEVAQQAAQRKQIVMVPLDGESELHVAAISLCREEDSAVLVVLVNSQVAARTTAAWWLPQVASCAELWAWQEAHRPASRPTFSEQNVTQTVAAKVAQPSHEHRRAGRMRWGATVAGIAVVAMAIPVPYEVRCECELQPVTRRFVAAPFEGTLERALVDVGDTVRAGEVLARMDGKEIRWEMAGNIAEYERAAKEPDALLADQKFGEAQVAKLQMDRLALTTTLLEHRSNHLEIRSPIDGIVVSGELKRAEGVRLSLGQNLFEVAPLDQMIVEVEIPESELAHVPAQTEAFIRLEAFPHDELRGTLKRVCPRAELRNKQQVFVGEIPLSNASGSLKPGMRGRASLAAGRAMLGWRLFHRAMGKFRLWWGA